MVTTCLGCLVLLVIFHEARVVVIRRVLFVAGTLYAMRSCTLLVSCPHVCRKITNEFQATQLPPGYENNTMRCREKANSSLGLFFSRLAEQTIRLGFQVGEKPAACVEHMLRRLGRESHANVELAVSVAYLSLIQGPERVAMSYITRGANLFVIYRCQITCYRQTCNDLQNCRTEQKLQLCRKQRTYKGPSCVAKTLELQ